MDISKTIKNLELRGYKVSYFEKGSDAADYICGSVSGTTVGIGGCMTAQELGLYERLSENNSVFWHWKDTSPDTRYKANAAAVYITSANAMTEDGEILNIDGNGNRLAGQVWGNKKLYIVAGVNKICPDFTSALDRARNVAAVKNIKRFDKKTPCAVDGKCHNCLSPDRICRALLVLWAPVSGMDAEVVLINEELGY